MAYCSPSVAQAAYFEQKFYATFFLAPSTADQQPPNPVQQRRKPERTRSADSRSPRSSPRDLPEAHHSVSPLCPAAPRSPQEHDRQHNSPDADSHTWRETDAAPAESGHVLQGRTEHDSSMDTPDLSPRGDLEAEDPPTPRMYKAIVPTAAPAPVQKPASERHHSPRLRPETSQVVLHQGHYDHDRQLASPQRQTQSKGQAQALEEVRRIVRHVTSLSPACECTYVLHAIV